MFEVLRDIEDCPATVLSSHRQFVCRLDLLDISKGHKGDPLAIYMFSDSMEIARRRHSIKSTSKPFKHLEFLPYTYLKYVINFEDSEDLTNALGLLVQWPEDPQEKLLVFRLEAEDSSKTDTVQQLAKLMAEAHFSTSSEHFIVSCPSDTILSLNRTNSSTTLHRALHGVRKKVRRAFSSRSSRKSLASMSVHMNLQGIGEENEPPPSPDAVSISLGSPNTSTSCSVPNLAFTPISSVHRLTPIASLRTPRAKRPALSNIPSFSAADISHFGT
jgi:hypothetical protein